MYDQLTMHWSGSYFLIFCIQLNENYHALGTFHCNVIKEIGQTSSAFRHPPNLFRQSYAIFTMYRNLLRRYIKLLSFNETWVPSRAAWVASDNCLNPLTSKFLPRIALRMAQWISTSKIYILWIITLKKNFFQICLMSEFTDL